MEIPPAMGLGVLNSRMGSPSGVVQKLDMEIPTAMGLGMSHCPMRRRPGNWTAS